MKKYEILIKKAELEFTGNAQECLKNLYSLGVIEHKPVFFKLAANNLLLILGFGYFYDFARKNEKLIEERVLFSGSNNFTCGYIVCDYRVGKSKYHVNVTIKDRVIRGGALHCVQEFEKVLFFMRYHSPIKNAAFRFIGLLGFGKNLTNNAVGVFDALGPTGEMEAIFSKDKRCNINYSMKEL